MAESSTKEEPASEEGGGEPDLVQVLGSLIMALLIKYWIYICGGMFFFVSFEGRIVMYKIIYMMMFLSCVALYQVHYEWWRRALKYFWMSVVMYTMLVLILVYTFQFQTSPPFWINLTGMSLEKLKDLGLERFSMAMLFSRILIPSSFLLVCILHLHYFHDGFLQLTDLQALVAKEESTIYRLAHPDGSLADLTLLSSSSVEEPSSGCENRKSGGVPEEMLVVVTSTEEEDESLGPRSRVSGSEESRGCSQGGNTEPSTEQNSELKNKWHLVVDRLTVLFLKFLEYFHKLQLFIWWLLEIHVIKIVSCYIIMVAIKEELVDPANWVGLRKSKPLLEYLRNNLLMLAILAFEVTIYRHQQYYRLRNKLTPPAARIIFHGITRQHLDHGIVNFVKYFVNYFFYKFGLETICIHQVEL
ncbi:hypothetical protein CRUP_035752 [Coryphaenoides rupestris]|nr:hypothetical protein CRUP_035752 [Coryphaenoides rupestris]